MNFFQSIKYCLKHYSDFNGRASRSEFWWFFLFENIVVSIGEILDYGFLSYLDADQEWGTFETISYIAFIPLIVWWCTKGTKKNNSHGKPIKLKR